MVTQSQIRPVKKAQTINKNCLGFLLRAVNYVRNPIFSRIESFKKHPMKTNMIKLIQLILQSDFVEVNGEDIDCNYFEYFFDPNCINVTIDGKNFAFDANTELDFSKRDIDHCFEITSKDGVVFKMAFVTEVNGVFVTCAKP